MNIPEREEGQGLVEYALVLVLIAVVVIAILTILGPQVVLVFARVAGGLQGDSLDAGSGDTAVIVSYDSTATGSSGSSCSGTISNVNFAVVDSSGKILTNQAVSAEIRVNGQGGAGNVSGTANNSGLASSSGSYGVAGTCPLQVTLE